MSFSQLQYLLHQALRGRPPVAAQTSDPSPATAPDARRGVGRSEPIRAIVLDSGGGQIGLLVHRSTTHYPPVGTKVTVTVEAD